MIADKPGEHLRYVALFDLEDLLVTRRPGKRSKTIDGVSLNESDTTRLEDVEKDRHSLLDSLSRVRAWSSAVSSSRPESMRAIRWMVNYSRARKERSMAERLAAEIMDASNGMGASVKRREDVFKMAEANRAFSHYRF